MESSLAAFRAQLTPNDLQEGEEANELAEQCSQDSDSDDDTPVDVSQEAVNEEFMWRLAEEVNWGPNESRHLCFVESAIAMPAAAVCVDCEQEDKLFSKSQLARHPE